MCALCLRLLLISIELYRREVSCALIQHMFVKQVSLSQTQTMSPPMYLPRAFCSCVPGSILVIAQHWHIYRPIFTGKHWLQDPGMQELLPFGEYSPPEHSQLAQHTYMGLEAWELERILARLAVTNGASTLTTGRRRAHPRAAAIIVPGKLLTASFVWVAYDGHQKYLLLFAETYKLYGCIASSYTAFLQLTRMIQV